MTLAIDLMDPTVTALFYIAAVVLFILAGLAFVWKGGFGWLGLACFAIPSAWNALAAS